MTVINLKNFYPWYTDDEMLEVTDEVAAELIADKRYEKSHMRGMRRNKILSFNAEDGIEGTATVCYNDSPERIFDVMCRHCGLCCALNSLPEIQGRRIEARFLLGMSQREIAFADGVSEEAVSKTIQKGLSAIRRYYINVSVRG